MGFVVKKKACSVMEETEIPGETHLDVQYEDVSNTINSVKEELSCGRSSSLVIAQAKL